MAYPNDRSYDTNALYDVMPRAAQAMNGNNTNRAQQWSQMTNNGPQQEMRLPYPQQYPQRQRQRQPRPYVEPTSPHPDYQRPMYQPHERARPSPPLDERRTSYPQGARSPTLEEPNPLRSNPNLANQQIPTQNRQNSYRNDNGNINSDQLREQAPEIRRPPPARRSTPASSPATSQAAAVPTRTTNTVPKPTAAAAAPAQSLGAQPPVQPQHPTKPTASTTYELPMSRIRTATPSITADHPASIADTASLSLRQTNTNGTVGTVGTIIEGSSRLYTPEGALRYVPMPTSSPKDPLNLPNWRKVLIISCVCFFGAMAAAAELILAALLPIFVLQYAGIDPHILSGITGLPTAPGGGVNPNPVDLLAGLGGPPLWKVTMLTTLPILVIGISNYILVPLAIAVGRRPVVLVCGALAWSGALWAGFSQSLDSHLAARAIQALGAGTVESLLPLIVQDIVFIHWRNRAISAIWAAQGIIIVSLGIGSPIIITLTDWRHLYYITAGCAAGAWVIMIFVLPETRWVRTNGELRGEPREKMPKGFVRPPLNPTRHGRRTLYDEIGFVVGGVHWERMLDAMIATLKSFFFPNILFITILNSIFIAITLAASQTGSSVLLTTPNNWPFQHLGLAVLPIVIASFFVAIISGYGADFISNYVTRTSGQGKREPEVHLLNMIFPLFCSVAGCLMFGAGGEYIGHISWMIFLVGIGLLSFGGLSINAIASVYCIECFPDWAGPILVNVASFRNIVGFAVSFQVTNWIAQIGFMKMFSVYAALLGGIGLVGIGALYYWGREMRRYCGRVVVRHQEIWGNKLAVDDEIFESGGVKHGKKGYETSQSRNASVEKGRSRSASVEKSRVMVRNGSVETNRGRQQEKESNPFEEFEGEMRARRRGEGQAERQMTDEVRLVDGENDDRMTKINWAKVKEYINMK